MEFILRVYAPLWFNIKLNSSCKFGASHVYRLVESTRYLSCNHKAVIDPVIQRNAFFCHPENLLLAMISDDPQHIRELGLRRILKARNNQDEKATEWRVFRIPKVNFQARDYTDLINWDMCVVTSPPILDKVSNDELKEFITIKETPDIPLYPCHTQAVERYIKLMTEASVSVVGPEKRDGFVRATMKSRETLKTFDSKKDFNVS